jgi:hypothetical protein
MHAITIELKKGRGGPSTLACRRADGSRTWAQLHPFLPTHDLTHCAVESALGMTEGFFGLVAGGWELDDFAKPGAAERLPAQALWAEHIVGLIERQVAGNAAGLNEALARSLTEPFRHGAPILSDKDLEVIDRLRRRLLTRWQGLAAGDTLRVRFPASLAGV